MPKPVLQIPQIRGALGFYRVMAWITGAFLLLVCVEMVLKYAFGYEIEAFGPNGLLSLAPNDAVTAVNVSTLILIGHGWLYVAYLFSNFRLWMLMRWPFWRFLAMAAGGVVPLMSFVVERQITKIAEAEIADLETEHAAMQSTPKEQRA